MSFSEDINFSINDPKQQNFLQTPKTSKTKIIIYILISLIIISIILILIFTLKKDDKNNEIKENLPSIYMENLETLKYCKFSVLTLNCFNLKYYKDFKNKDISFQFASNSSSNIYFSDEIIENSIKIQIPSEAISGNVAMNIGKLNFKYNFSIEIIKDFSIKINENIIKKEGNDMIISEKDISCTRNNYFIIYSFISPCSGKFDIELLASTNNDKSYINADIDSNITFLEKRGRNVNNLTNHIISKGMIFKKVYMEVFISKKIRNIF